MKKSYHEHCVEEHDEAMFALSNAQAKAKENISISYYLNNTRMRVISVARHKFDKVLSRLKEEGKKIISVNGTAYIENIEEKQPLNPGETVESIRDRAIDAYKTNCVFYEDAICNFTGTNCSTTYCSHLRNFITKLNDSNS